MAIATSACWLVLFGEQAEVARKNKIKLTVLNLEFCWIRNKDNLTDKKLSCQAELRLGV